MRPRLFQRPLARLVAASLAGALSALALLGVLYLLNPGVGFAQTTIATRFGWVLPLISGLIAIMLGWGLLVGVRSSRQSDGRAPDGRCPSCGGPVRGEWRLCPHCGERISGEQASVDETLRR